MDSNYTVDDDNGYYCNQCGEYVQGNALHICKAPTHTFNISTAVNVRIAIALERIAAALERNQPTPL